MPFKTAEGRRAHYLANRERIRAYQNARKEKFRVEYNKRERERNRKKSQVQRDVKQAIYEAVSSNGWIPFFSYGWRIAGWFRVDIDDVALVVRRRWNISPKGYVIGTDWNAGTQQTINLARTILGLTREDERQADHINGDRLDNRRRNLRAVTPAENAQNRRKIVEKTSRFRGVYYQKARNKNHWIATMTLNHQTQVLGSFRTEEEAANASALARSRRMPFSREARDA